MHDKHTDVLQKQSFDCKEYTEPAQYMNEADIFMCPHKRLQKGHIIFQGHWSPQ